MKTLLTVSLILLTSILHSQDCFRIERVWSTAKFRELNNPNTIKDFTILSKELLISMGQCHSESGKPLKIEITYFGGKRSNTDLGSTSTAETEIGVRLYYEGFIYDATDTIKANIRDVIMEYIEGVAPLNETRLYAALSAAIRFGYKDLLANQKK